MKQTLSILLVTLFSLGSFAVKAQEGPVALTSHADSMMRIYMVDKIRKFEILQIDDSTTIQILAGNVKLRQGSTLFYADSCVINKNKNTFEAWGKVHINDSDTAHAYSNHLRYLINRQIAYLDGNVRLTDGHGTLTAPSLDYDVQRKLGTYKNGGTVKNGTTLLNSKEGYYYTDLKEVYFKNKVELNDPDYKMRTDSLLFNTESSTARFIAQTFITDKDGREIETKDGFYNLQSGKAEFGRNPIIKDGATTITGESIAFDEATHTQQVIGNAIIRDTAQGTTVIAGEIYRNTLTEAIQATKKPLLIIKQEKDSIYVAADTLFTARITDLYGVNKDSLHLDTTLQARGIDGSKLTDSTNRYFEAYGNVRIYSDSLQAVADSLFYSLQDSVFRMFNDPVVWSRGSQISGDTLYLFTQNKQPHRFEAFNNSFVVNNLDPEVFNQVKSRRMEGYFTNGIIDSIQAKGYAESIYFVQDSDSAYVFIQEVKAEIMDIYFEEQELMKIVYRYRPSGTLWPMSHKEPHEMRLEGFKWLESRRPKTKYELFE